jgi:RNA methyltransferase, TrmH family
MDIISSRQNPIVRAFRDLAKTPSPDGTRLLLDGVHLVRDAAEADLLFEAVAIAASRDDDRSEEGRAAHALRSQHVDVMTVSDQAFEAISPVRAPSGIAAIVRRPAVTSAGICREPDAFVLAAVDVQDPGNLGALIRSAEAGGATGVIVCGDSANPFSWKSARGSMGSLLRLPVTTEPGAGAAIDTMRAAGGRIVATTPRDGKAPEAVDWRGRILLMLGGEGPGLDDALARTADDRVSIPMARPVESLNVAVAGAVLVYAARRQRT